MAFLSKKAIEVLLTTQGKGEIEAKTYLNYANISIIPHHCKDTISLFARLCEHFAIEFFVVTDADLDKDLLIDVLAFKSEEDLKESLIYQSEGSRGKKGLITKNFRIGQSTKFDRLHFNTPRLEEVIGYTQNDKSSSAIWMLINVPQWTPPKELFPQHLYNFLEIDEALADY